MGLSGSKNTEHDIYHDIYYDISCDIMITIVRTGRRHRYQRFVDLYSGKPNIEQIYQDIVLTPQYYFIIFPPSIDKIIVRSSDPMFKKITVIPKQRQVTCSDIYTAMFLAIVQEKVLDTVMVDSGLIIMTVS